MGAEFRNIALTTGLANRAMLGAAPLLVAAVIFLVLALHFMYGQVCLCGVGGCTQRAVTNEAAALGSTPLKGLTNPTST